MSEDVDMTALQLKLEDRSTTFDEKDAWADDRLGNLSKVSETLIGIVKGQERPLTICLNGEWGSGKTFFLTRLAHDYNKLEDGTRAIYYNAWQDDFLEDPLLAIICQLEKVVKEGAGAEFIAAIKEAAIPCLASAGLAIAKSFLRNKIGVDIDSIGLDDLSTQQEEIFNIYQKMDASRSVLKEAIANLSDAVWQKTGKPLLFIIDELDRCRPTFAIELLERIKHLFNVPHLVFLVGVDLNQLGKSIQAVYGDINSNDYLHRFFDVEMKLPVGDKYKFFERLWEVQKLNSILHLNDMDIYAPRNLMQEFKNLVVFRNVTLRQIEKCVRTYALLAASSERRTCAWPLLTAIAVVLKMTDLEAYDKFIHLKYSLGELIGELYPGATYDDVVDEGGIFLAVKTLSNIAYNRSAISESHVKLESVKKAIESNGEIAFDSKIMPPCFLGRPSDQLAQFYSCIFNEKYAGTYYPRPSISEILERIDKGLRLIA